MNIKTLVISALCLGIGNFAGCGSGEEGERPELQALGGKADIPSWLRHIPADWGCDQTLSGQFTGWDSAHLYSFPGKVGYEYTFDFAASYGSYKGAVIAVYDSETGARVAFQRNRWDSSARVVYEAAKSIKYLVAVYSVSWYAHGSYTLSAACEVVAVEPTPTQCEQAGGYCTHWMTPCNDGFVGGTPMDCPMGRSGKCCVAGVTVTTSAKGYTTQEQIAATVSNDTQQSAFLGGCSALSWQKQVNGAWVPQGPDHVCVWEGYAVELKAGETHAETLGPRGEGTFRLSAAYGVGCTPGQPLSQASCAAHLVAYSAPLKVKDCPLLAMPNPSTFCPDGKLVPTHDADGICVAGYDCAVCEALDCGPAPGMPTSLCDDGVSTSGPTGKCLGNGWGGCAWEILSCPE